MSFEVAARGVIEYRASVIGVRIARLVNGDAVAGSHIAIVLVCLRLAHRMRAVTCLLLLFYASALH